MRRIILLNIVLGLLSTGLAPAATRLVPDEYPNIQSAIDDCNDGDVVIVAVGTYFEMINLKGKNITLRSTDPNDLSGCMVGEYVDYPGTPDPNDPYYYWPSPTWAAGSRSPDPTTSEGSATAGFGTDTHWTSPYATPYQAVLFSAPQIYRYKSCAGNYTTLMGPHSIVRSVFADPNCGSGWRYEVKKTGSQATVCLP